MPYNGPFAKNNPDEKYVKEEFKLSSMRDEDPREALLKYASKQKDGDAEEDDEDEPTSKRVKR
jgi:hypothetical protein